LDQERVKPIAERLSSLGYSVAWDKPQRAGQAHIAEIERALDSAKVVLAVWSMNARNSTLVVAEASIALDTHKLVQLRIDGAAAPAPFDALTCADMSNERASAWGPLEDTLTRIVRDGVHPEAANSVRDVGILGTPAAAGSPRLLTVAIGATLAAFFGALSATVNGATSPEQLQVALVGVVGVGGACAALAAHRFITVSRAGG
jgi:hypothetical protein